MWLLRVVGYHWRPGDHVSSADYTRKIGSPYHPLKCDLGIDRHKSFTQRQIHVIISICWRNSLSATGMQELEIVSTKMESLVLKKKNTFAWNTILAFYIDRSALQIWRCNLLHGETFSINSNGCWCTRWYLSCF